MAGKRSAGTELTAENWDKEDEHEEKGIFQVASSEELQTRVIKKAKRKLTGEGSGNAETKSIFSGFSGFTKTPITSTTAANATDSPFSFLSKLSSSTTSGAATASNIGAITTTDKKESKKDEPGKQATSSSNYQFEKSNNYYGKLKGLNQSVSNWIKKHVDENPLCILTPIFQDYEKYLKEIEQDKEKDNLKPSSNQFTFGTTSNSSNGNAAVQNKEQKDTTNPFISSSVSSSILNKEKTSEVTAAVAKTKPMIPSSGGMFSFLKTTDPASTGPATSTTKTSSLFGTKTENSAVTSTSPKFSFGQKAPIYSEKITATTSAAGVPSQSLFSFKPSTTSASSTTGFSFSGSKPFTFGTSSVSKPEGGGGGASDTIQEEEEEDDQPPKVEFKPVVEEDSVFSKKCKVFVKQKDSYADRGVGTLYLKPVKDSEKTQLLVRADTNLGNILLNFILNEAIPTQRMGKNNVMMICIPTPESDQKPTPVLLRVKTGEEADDLLETINKYKK